MPYQQIKNEEIDCVQCEGKEIVGEMKEMVQ